MSFGVENGVERIVNVTERVSENFVNRWPRYTEIGRCFRPRWRQMSEVLSQLTPLTVEGDKRRREVSSKLNLGVYLVFLVVYYCSSDL